MTKANLRMKLIKLSLCSGLVTIGTVKTILDFSWVNLILTILWFIFYIVDFKNILENF